MTNLFRIRIRLSGLIFRLARIARRVLGIVKTVYVQQRVDSYRQFWSDGAEQLGLELTPLNSEYWAIRDGDRVVTRLNNYLVQLDDPVTLNIAGDKVLTFQLLEAGGLSIPSFSVIKKSAPETFLAFVQEHGFPCVVKPARGTSSGLGISTMVSSKGQCASAVATALAYCDEAIIERHIAGECYRLLFLDGRLIRAARRGGIRVRGDGHTNLDTLITRALEEQERTPVARPGDDKDIMHTLTEQRLDLTDVPDEDTSVLVRSTALFGHAGAEVRTEYDEDVSHLICRQLADECADAVRRLGSDFCGVDVITVDPGISLTESGGVIDEINTTPGIHHHHGLLKADEDVASVFIDEAILAENVAALVLRFIIDRQ